MSNTKKSEQRHWHVAAGRNTQEHIMARLRNQKWEAAMVIVAAYHVGNTRKKLSAVSVQEHTPQQSM